MTDGVAWEHRKRVSLFYSYSHKDEDLRQKLQEHLAVLRRRGLIGVWNDRDIDAGDDWAKTIDRNLAGADIVLLLVSASFLASDFCWSQEMTKAVQRHDRGDARVIPVILRPCQWQNTPFAKLQAVPKDARPVTVWADQDAAFDDVAGKITRVVCDILEKRSRAQTVTADVATAQAGRPEQHAPGSRPKALADIAVFRDLDALWCPELVALPGGEFLMGSSGGDPEGYSFERPQHRVTISHRFAIGRYPVTFEEYDHFCSLTKGQKPEDQDWGRGWRPLIDVSWRDAQAYVDWLAEATGKPYRLPTEGEWEYAARAGTVTRFAFGDEITPNDANYGSNVGKTTEVGLYPPNPWGLSDMHGNVWEWVQDVWHDTYKGAPADGSAWIHAKGKFSSHRRVIRGGSWYYDSRNLRSSFRSGFEPNYRGDDLGFRIARTLAGSGSRNAT